jgi:hypothetical protein
MAGEKGNKKHANKTSYPNQKNNKKNPAVVLRKFKEMLYNAENDDTILCFQDACKSINWRDSKVNYWCRIIPIFATLKTDIQNRIISRINKNALNNDFNATSSIWRMKQLGELDQQFINQKSETTVKIPDISKEEMKKINEKLESDV